jgi:hypothetical protein
MHKLIKHKRKFLFLSIFTLITTALITFYAFLNNKPKGDDFTTYVSNSVAECKKNTKEEEKIYCFEKIIDVILARGDPDPAFDLISGLYKSEPNFAQTCHSLAHKIGEKAYAQFKTGDDFKLSEKTAYCSYGFYHGFMETLLINTKDISEAGAFCDYVDKKLRHITGDAKLSCYHGIGHGTVGVHDPRVKGDTQKLIDPAIELCEQVSTNEDQMFRCSSGVFNAIAIFIMTGEYSLPLDRDDPLSLCRKQKENLKTSCYGNMNTVLSWMTRNSFKDASRFAEKEPDDDHAVTTIEYLIAYEAYQNDTDELIDTCRALQDRLHLPCIKGLAHGFMEKGNPGVEYIKTRYFCDRADLSKEEKFVCYKELINYSNRIYPKEKAREVCKSLPESFNKYCI